MADQQSRGATRGGRGGFGERGGRGGARGGAAGGAPGGPRPRAPAQEEKEWVPVTKLGRLVKEGKITSIEEIYAHGIPIKEYQIVDIILAGKLKDEVFKIATVQKQTRAGQRTRFKAFVVMGDNNGHIGLGVRVGKEVATAIRGAINAAKIAIIPIRRGYWGSKIGAPHTVPCKVTGKCGSIKIRLIPAPRGTGIVASPVPKRFLSFAGIEDIFTQTEGSTKTTGNFIKAIYAAVKATYAFLSPELWKKNNNTQSPYGVHSEFLARTGGKLAIGK